MSTRSSVRPVLERALLLAGALLPFVARPAVAQKPSDAVRDSILANGITAGEADDERKPRDLLDRLRFDFGFMTLNIGGGLLYDAVVAAQDSASARQIRMKLVDGGLRDARILMGGRFASKRPITWQVGVMYDKPTNKWLFRQTGLMVAVPEIWSHFFVGRAKEGFSLNKVMTGYDGWTMERQPFTDATVPLLADGVKWLGITPDEHWFWNVGWFSDVLSAGQTFSSYDNQFVVRAGWAPLVADTAGTLLHFGMNFRRGAVHNRQLQLRSKPQSFLSPYFIDTGKFPANTAEAFGPEVYYRPGRLLVGTELYWQRVNAPTVRNPWFHGGDFVVSWLVTGETRSYNNVGSYFRSVIPRRTVVQGGPGAWEAVLDVNYANLDGGDVRGGVFWRFTPMLNWHMTDNVRLEFAYGYGTLERFALVGRTNFFQTRLQMQL